MSNRQGVAYDADNLVTLTPGSLTFNGTTYDVTANGSAAAAQLTANTALAIANAALPKAGGTMTGQINMSNQKIVSLGTPTVSTDAATKGYVDTSVVGLLDLQGTIDCSTNPNYPAANKGDVWVVSVAGLIGGVAGISVQAGDALVALADNPGGTQAAVGSSWSILQANLVGALLAVNNLSDVQNVATARTNLGLGTAATQNSTAFATAAQGVLASTAVQRAGDTMTGALSLNGTSATFSINCGTISELKFNNGAASLTPTLGVGNTGASGKYAALLAGTSGAGFYFDKAGTFAIVAQAKSGYTGNTLGDGTYTRLNISSTGRVDVQMDTLDAPPGLGVSPPRGFGITPTAALGALHGVFAAVQGSGAAWVQVQRIDGTATAYPLLLQPSGSIVGIGVTSPTAVLHLKAGTASANTSPLKFTSGTNLTTPEAGAMEYNGTLSFTDSSAARKDVALKTTYTPTLTPALIVGTGYTEQTFTVTGLATSDTVIVNGPAAAANSVLVHARVSAANTLALTWITDAANITPTSGTYRIVAIRS